MSKTPRFRGAPPPPTCLPTRAGGGGRLVAIDPGLRRCGFAVFQDARLDVAGLVRGLADTKAPAHEAWSAMATPIAAAILDGGQPVDRLVVEFPRVHRAAARGAAVGADPSDLLQLAAVIGAITEHAKLRVAILSVETVLPSEWKGTIAKSIIWNRVKWLMEDGELMRINWPPLSLCEHVIEAVGIGLWACGRAGRAMTRRT